MAGGKENLNRPPAVNREYFLKNQSAVTLVVTLRW
jgi:hypothetical protein